VKQWDNIVIDEVYGLCTVAEATDDECEKSKLAPISHGFVNLFHGSEHVAWCGVNYAEQHIWKAANGA
jgi:hypothetical protein